MTYPSEALIKRENGYRPPVDLVAMFLELSEELNMEFFFGAYDSGNYWHNGNPEVEIEINKRVVEEAWNKYGKSKAFHRWYLNQEVRRYGQVVEIYAKMGEFCKTISGNLPVMISPYIAGVKAVNSSS